MATKLEKLIKEIADEIAAVNFDVNLDIYHEGADFYADFGITESTYMRTADEGVVGHFEEDLSERILDCAMKTYKKLYVAKYGTKKWKR